MKLPTNKQIKRMVQAARESGLPIGPIAVTSNGVIIYPPGDSAGMSAYDQWEKQDNERAAHRQ